MRGAVLGTTVPKTAQRSEMGFIIGGMPLPGQSVVGSPIPCEDGLYTTLGMIKVLNSQLNLPPPWVIQPHAKAHFWEPDGDMKYAYKIHYIAMIFGSEIPKADEKQDWPIFLGKHSAFASFIMCFATKDYKLTPFPKMCCAASISREVFEKQAFWHKLYHDERKDHIHDEFTVDISFADLIAKFNA